MDCVARGGAERIGASRAMLLYRARRSIDDADRGGRPAVLAACCRNPFRVGIRLDAGIRGLADRRPMGRWARSRCYDGRLLPASRGRLVCDRNDGGGTWLPRLGTARVWRRPIFLACRRIGTAAPTLYCRGASCPARADTRHPAGPADCRRRRLCERHDRRPGLVGACAHRIWPVAGARAAAIAALDHAPAVRTVVLGIYVRRERTRYGAAALHRPRRYGCDRHNCAVPVCCCEHRYWIDRSRYAVACGPRPAAAPGGSRDDGGRRVLDIGVRQTMLVRFSAICVGASAELSG